MHPAASRRHPPIRPPDGPPRSPDQASSDGSPRVATMPFVASPWRPGRAKGAGAAVGTSRAGRPALARARRRGRYARPGWFSPATTAARSARLGRERHRLAGRVRPNLAGGPHPPAPALPDIRQDAPGCRRGAARSRGRAGHFGGVDMNPSGWSGPARGGPGVPVLYVSGTRGRDPDAMPPRPPNPSAGPGSRTAPADAPEQPASAADQRGRTQPVSANGPASAGRGGAGRR